MPMLCTGPSSHDRFRCKGGACLSLSKALVALSALAFVLAVVTNFVGVFLTTSEGYSRASANLGILAIALVYCFRSDGL